MKIIKWISENILFVISLFLLAFIPLFPKIPLLDIQHTWVYVRAEDFVVAFALLVWVILFLRKKVTLKTPLTLPIMLFWIIGGIATLHGVLLIFPMLSDAFSNVALLSYLRRIEYMSLFFIAFSGMKSKKFLPYVIATIVIVLLAISGYGFGQRFLGFPAFLTMNEEFAKGVPIQLSALSRIPSTFAGHYDLAAYLVLIIPIVISLFFGFKNLFVKLLLLGAACLGFVLLFLTVSRVSFFVLLVSLVVLLFLQKKRVAIISLFALTVVLLILSPRLIERFGSTVTEANVLVDATTGEAIGHIKEVPSSNFSNRLILTRGLADDEVLSASSSAVLANELLPLNVFLLEEANIPTGESLPQGTGYINLALSPVLGKIDKYIFDKTSSDSVKSLPVHLIVGNYVIKRALTYDLSFTTRFQGEWPRTIEAFKKNILIGSGYGAVSLAVDNNYLRILGETGLLGFIAFMIIFITAGTYIKKILSKVESPIVRSFVFGFIAGTCGLMLNAVLIDVFEASKVAFTYWTLMGIVIGTMYLYKTGEVNIMLELKKVFTSTYAIVIYLLLLMIALFSSVYNSFFTGDDFTWLRWVSECSKNGAQQCGSIINNMLYYFIHSDGFFYRPGTKIYFLLMNSAFWLNPTVYHIVSISLHFLVAVLIFLITKRIFKNYFLATLCGAFFIILSGSSEAIYWISSTGFLFNAMFVLLGLLFFIYWKEKKHLIFFILSLISITLSLLFHELGIVSSLFIIAYDMVYGGKQKINGFSRKFYYPILLFPIIPYLILRYTAQSHWFNGDYSYNLIKLPFNVVGNIIGYIGLSLVGPSSLSMYEKLRDFSRTHIALSIFASAVLLILIVFLVRMLMKKLKLEDRKIVIIGSLFFIIALLPFLGLGNITSRYSYLSSVGFVILLVFVFDKVHRYLVEASGRQIGTVTMIVIVLIFSMVNIFQMQKIQDDWKSAGEKARRLLISMNDAYIGAWTKDSVQFYFVNVPIRHGEAWVFPVGLKDAVWFAFQNDKIAVHQVPSLDDAYSAVHNPLKDIVFLFDEGGGVVQKIKPIIPPTVQIK